MRSQTSSFRKCFTQSLKIDILITFITQILQPVGFWNWIRRSNRNHIIRICTWESPIIQFLQAKCTPAASPQKFISFSKNNQSKEETLNRNWRPKRSTPTFCRHTTKDHNKTISNFQPSTRDWSINLWKNKNEYPNHIHQNKISKNENQRKPVQQDRAFFHRHHNWANWEALPLEEKASPVKESFKKLR